MEHLYLHIAIILCIIAVFILIKFPEQIGAFLGFIFDALVETFTDND